MNNNRRKRISDIIERLESLQGDIEELKNEEEEAYDNIPEGLKSSERGESCENAIFNLDEAYSALDDVINYLNDATE